MKQRKIIISLGIASMILFTFQSANAQNIKYTKSGHVACISEKYYDLAVTFVAQNDMGALSRMITNGQCFMLKANVPVYMMEYKLWSGKMKIRPQGFTEGVWTDWKATDDHMESTYQAPDKKVGDNSNPAKSKYVTLKSFLWIETDKTTKQEIKRKYGKPSREDEAGGEIVYRGDQHPDFKEWASITFLFDGDVLGEIRPRK